MEEEQAEKWNRAYDAIRQEGSSNGDAVVKRTEMIMLLLADKVPLDITTAAALFAAGVSAAGLLLGPTPVEEVEGEP